MYSKNCIQCSKEMFRMKKSEANRKNWFFCSRRCRGISNGKKKLTISIECKCPFCNLKFNKKKFSKQTFCSNKCSLLFRNKFNNPAKNKINTLKRSGKNHYRWNEFTSINMRERKSIKMKEWRKSIFERDNYTCKKCNIIGGKLQAHHIKSFAKYPKLRYEISNGITLCIECHKLTDNYAGKSHNKHLTFD